MTTPLSQNYLDAQGWIGQSVGNYRLVRLLGEGGMGMVFEAVHDGVGGKAAIKILRPEISVRSELAARFFNEARAANAIQHPGIVRIFDSGYTQNRAAFLAMEYLEGESLRARLQRHGRLPLPDVVRIGRQLASALLASHRKGIVHRDLKPDNIMLVADPDLPSGERVKVLDFGIAKMTESLGALPHATDSNIVMGTPAYMSPEQCKGAKLVNDRADVYSLGVILFQMVAGRPPFVAETAGAVLIMQVVEAVPALEKLVPGINRAFAGLVRAMLAKEAASRPAMESIMSALQSVESAVGSVRPGSVPDDAPTRQFALPLSGRDTPSAAQPHPALHPNMVTDVAGQASAGFPSSNKKRRMGILVGVAAASLVGALGTAAGFLKQPPQRVLATQPMKEPAPPSVSAPRLPEARPAEPVRLPEPGAAPVSSPEEALKVSPRPPAPPAAKAIDPHYAAARQLIVNRQYQEAIAETALCGREYQFMCSVLRAKASCHTVQRNLVQDVLASIRESKRPDKEKWINEIRAACESDGLDFVAKLLSERQYQRARTVAYGTRSVYPERAWMLYGIASCGLEDRRAVAEALSWLDKSSVSAARVRSACKPALLPPK